MPMPDAPLTEAEIQAYFREDTQAEIYWTDAPVPDAPDIVKLQTLLPVTQHKAVIRELAAWLQQRFGIRCLIGGSPEGITHGIGPGKCTAMLSMHEQLLQRFQRGKQYVIYKIFFTRADARRIQAYIDKSTK